MARFSSAGFLVITLVGGLLHASSALADVSPELPAPPTLPAAEPSSNTAIRCRYQGVNGPFLMVCEARAEANLHSPDTSESRDDRTFLRVGCNGQPIYRGDVRSRVKHGPGGDDRDVDVFLSGKRQSSPRIRIGRVDLRELDAKGAGRENRNRPSILRFAAGGIIYTIGGRCNLEKAEDPVRYLQ
jgi:hypothetical protein